MSREKIRFSCFLLLTLLYYVFFWQEKMGLNVLLFSSMVIVLLFVLSPGAIRSKSVWVTALGSFLTADLVVLYNSGTAKVVHICSLLLFVGFVHQPQVKTVIYALGGLFSGWGSLLGQLRAKIPAIALFPSWMGRQWVHLRVSFIPLVVVSVFYFLFKFANPRFEMLAGGALDWLGNGILHLFCDIDLAKILFFLSGLLVTAGLLFPKPNPKILQAEQKHSDDLIPNIKAIQASSQGVEKEKKMGILCMLLVNGLLLVNNLIDVDWIWLNFSLPAGFNLSQFVHEGTYLLILSILLSMGIMLFFFRGNQNFSTTNVWLKRLSYLWIAQNIILVISVSLRNYHYIDVHGLAYKRIGVVFFLALTVFGLWTLLRKIQNRKSAFYLLRTNSWAVYVVMLVICLVNWDPVIAEYNFSKEKKLDTSYLLSLSDKALPILLEHQEVFSDTRVARRTTIIEKDMLTRKVNRFQVKQEGYSWLSWNLSDHKTKAHLFAAPIPSKDAFRSEAW